MVTTGDVSIHHPLRCLVSVWVFEMASQVRDKLPHPMCCVFLQYVCSNQSPRSRADPAAGPALLRPADRPGHHPSGGGLPYREPQRGDRHRTTSTRPQAEIHASFSLCPIVLFIKWQSGARYRGNIFEDLTVGGE